MAYFLDANVFISAKNLHYGLDFCPAFWDWIIANNASGAQLATSGNVRVGNSSMGSMNAALICCAGTIVVQDYFTRRRGGQSNDLHNSLSTTRGSHASSSTGGSNSPCASPPQ